MTLEIRLATVADLPAINAIYNHYVQHSTCTYQLAPSSAGEREAWFARHGPRLPVTVVQAGGAAAPAERTSRAEASLAGPAAGPILGWASLTPLHERPAYRFTVEDSVYVHPDRRHRGIGRALLADLLRRSDELGYRNVIASISADQEPSIALHRQMGFTEAGRLVKVGYKFGRWLDVLYMQRTVPHWAGPGDPEQCPSKD
jgi:L-amino acid N-acyltransferase